MFNWQIICQSSCAILHSNQQCVRIPVWGTLLNMHFIIYLNKLTQSKLAYSKYIVRVGIELFVYPLWVCFCIWKMRIRLELTSLDCFDVQMRYSYKDIITWYILNKCYLILLLSIFIKAISHGFAKSFIFFIFSILSTTLKCVYLLYIPCEWRN